MQADILYAYVFACLWKVCGLTEGGSNALFPLCCTCLANRWPEMIG